jgi:hypothetical protein
MQELLADGLAGEAQFIGELGDRARPLALQCDQDGAAAVGKLINGCYGVLFSGRTETEIRILRPMN